MATVAEVSKKVNLLRSYWTQRNDRINDWLRLETLVDENAEAGFESMVTNDPASVMSLSVHLLSGQPLKHRIRVGGQDEAAYQKAGRLERALEGWWNLIDEMGFYSGHDAVVRELAYWMTLMGWYAVRLGMVQREGVWVPVVDLHDPRESFQEYGNRLEGMTAYAHSYTTTLAEAQAQAREHGLSPRNVAGDGTQAITISELYTKSGTDVLYQAIYSMPNGRGAEFLHTEERLPWKAIPVLTGPVGGSPYRLSGTQEVASAWQQRMGQSVLEANRKLWQNYNKYYSLLLEVAKNFAEPDKIRLRLDEGGERRTDVRGGGHVYQTDDPTARITNVEPGRFPFEIFQVLQSMDAQAQRGGFPYVLFGGVNLQLSGFAINQLLQAALHKLGPYKLAMQRVVKEADRWFLSEFRRLGSGSVVLSGKAHGQGVFLERFNPDDVPAEYAVEVDIDLSLPSDMLERISIIRNAIPGNQPILDILTALEDVLRIDDPKLVLDRIQKDVLGLNPDIQRINSIHAIRTRADELERLGAHETAALMRQYAEFMMRQAGQVMGQAPVARTEPPPEAMPPEMTGASPSAVRAMRRPGAANLMQRFGVR